MNRYIRRVLFGLFAAGLLAGSYLPAQSPVSRAAPQGREEKALDSALARLKTIRHAEDGLAIVNGLLEDKSVSPANRAMLQKEAAVWKERKEKGLVRNGSAWITPAEKEGIEKEADLLIEKAFILIEAKDYRAARDALERASRIDETGLRADFLLGMLNTPMIANSPETAEKHFRKVLNRAPCHVPTLNNLALSCVRQRDFTKALDCWRQMGEVAPNTPELSHNLGKLLDDSAKGLIVLNASEKRKIQDLYLDIATAENAPSRYQQGGWRYMHLTLPKEEAGRTTTGNSGAMSMVATGSGFVIAPGVVLTNRHVVDDAHSVKIEYESPAGRLLLDATVKKISEKHDLALLECRTLTAPPVSVMTDAQRRGTEVMILGYPETGVLGKTLKATRGSITALPSDEYGGMLLFDAAANHGNSGGPIADQQGNVLAVLTVGYKLAGQITGGVTLANAVPFVQESYPNFTPRTAAKKLEWPDVDAAVAKSTVMVAVYQKVVKLAATPAIASDNRSYIEDSVCSFCNKDGFVRCPAKGCNRGQVSFQERVQAGNNPLTGQAIFKTVTTKQRCGTCGGKGKVPCGHCGGGGLR